MPLKNQNKICGKFKIIPITPIHISDTEKYLNFEYYIEPSQRRFYLKDLIKFFMDNSQDHETAVKIMKDMQYIPKPQYIRYTLPVYAELDKFGKLYSNIVQPTEQVLAFMKDPFNQPYIPGSSLKGCIRTAIIYSFLDDVCSSIKSNVLDEIYNKITKLDKKEKTIEEKILRGYIVPNKDAKYDLFKGLIIRDSQPFYLKNFDEKYLEIPNFGICKIQIFNKSGNKIMKTGIEIFAECLLPNTYYIQNPIEIPFFIDKFVLDKIINRAIEDIKNQLDKAKKDNRENIIESIERKLKNLENNEKIYNRLKDILSSPKNFTSALKKFSDILVKTQQNFFKNSALDSKLKELNMILSQKDKIFLQIGFGTGYLSKTIALLYTDDAIIEIQKSLRLGHKKTTYNEYVPFPRSKHLSTSMKEFTPSLPMGWFELQIEWDNT